MALNNFELDEKAKELSDSKSSYGLARDVLKLREENEALRRELEQLSRPPRGKAPELMMS